MVTLSPTQSIEVRVLNVSVGGMAIVAAANPRAGIIFTIKVPIPTSPTGVVIIEARAQVIHSVLARDQDGFKIGLRFIDLRDTAAAAIRQYLES
jgi:c-di-GMP-binding flagellar brake protein YcgR